MQDWVAHYEQQEAIDAFIRWMNFLYELQALICESERKLGRVTS